MVNIKARPYSSSTAQQLAANGLHPLLAQLLAARGVAADDALDASLKHLITPNLLTNNQQMAVALANAIAAQQAILVVGDFLRSYNFLLFI